MTLYRPYNFKDVPTIEKFFNSNSRIRAIVGPFGSGKSSGCVQVLLKTAFNQQPDQNNVRRTRFAIVRNTYRQLKDTTKITIERWLPFAHWTESDHAFRFKVKDKDGYIVESEWLLRALDRPEHTANLLSLEITAAWINEAKEIEKDIFDALDSRVGRYPETVRENGKIVFGPTWAGIILDTNPCDVDHWFFHYFEVLRPPGAEIFHQPSGLSPQAENINNLAENYYQNLCIGKDQAWIDVYVHGKYGLVKEGNPVFSLYNDSIHCAQEPLAPIPGHPLIIGMDMGLFPACVITQQPGIKLFVLDELVSEDSIDILEFVKLKLFPLLTTEKYRFKEYIIVGDPAGKARSQLDGRTCFQELAKMNIRAYPAYTNSLQLRLNAVNKYLSRIDPDTGKSAFLLSPTCVKLRQALIGKYHFKRVSLGGGIFSDVPVKNMYSHVADALQYAALGFSLSEPSSVSVYEPTKLKCGGCF